MYKKEKINKTKLTQQDIYYNNGKKRKNQDATI